MRKIGKLDRDDIVARLTLLPTIVISLIFVYGFILFTIYISFTNSKILPNNDWIGIRNYIKLFKLNHWMIALKNMGIFFVLYIGLSTLIGLFLAILIDLNRLGESIFRPIFIYPMAISFIVTGTAWKWFLDPGIGLEHIMRLWGFKDFVFDWIKNSEKSIYTVVIAAIWQVSGFVMINFLAGIRAIEHSTIESAVVDGASTFRLYTRIIIPQLGPSFFSVFVILAHLAIKSYDLVVALTGGGPGRSSELPSTFMYSYTFTRNQMGVGAASSIFMLIIISLFVIPYVYKQARKY